jgi:signal transduction histidine kinase
MLRDVVALSAIPAMWIGSEPPAVAAGLADTLVGMLQLDFAFVRLNDPGSDEALEVTRGSPWKSFPEWLERQVATSLQFPADAVVLDVGDNSEPRRAVAIPIGVTGEGGLVAVASERGDFPTALEQVLLSLAASHAATAFENARLIQDRRRAEEELQEAKRELEATVDERSAELHVANDALSALRRVATLVARGVQPQDLFAVVAEEVSCVVDVPAVSVVRYESDGTATECANFFTGGRLFPVGARMSIDGTNILRLVRDTSKAARIDDYAETEGEMAEIVRRAGVRSTVGVPIVAAGRVWGTMVGYTTEPEPLPVDIEARLTDFSELLATAIENAESREALQRLVDEQAALRRIATLVVEGATEAELFTCVAREVSQVFGVGMVTIDRYDSDSAFSTVVASVDDPGFPIGSRWPLDGPSLGATVLATARPARIDDYSNLQSTSAAAMRAWSVNSAVGVPILVDSRVWGVICVGTTDSAPLPETVELRLADFTELVATAIARAEARQAVAQLAQEQAALHRVATLVAHRAPPEELFAAVTEEVGHLLQVTSAAMGRYDPDGMFTTVAAWSTGVVAFPVGRRWIPQGKNVTTLVFETGSPARIDDFADASGPVGVAAREAGYRSAVGTPIIVEGRLWGVMTAASAKGSLPPDTEKRLERFTELVATAIANAESRSELAASRRRIVAASDEARRRIERDLHDGTQQRLITLLFQLTALKEAAPTGQVLTAELSRIEGELASALDDLREMSRGIHPAILSEGGLGPALRVLARRSTIPVELDITTDTRLSEPFEAAAYYVASEALANTTKHAQASRIEVSLALRNDSLLLSVRDDGVGGADFGRGSGLVGLQDRVEALGGKIRIDSPPGGGTSLVVTLPRDIEPIRGHVHGDRRRSDSASPS